MIKILVLSFRSYIQIKAITELLLNIHRIGRFAWKKNVFSFNQITIWSVIALDFQSQFLISTTIIICIYTSAPIKSLLSCPKNRHSPSYSAQSCGQEQSVQAMAVEQNKMKVIKCQTKWWREGAGNGFRTRQDERFHCNNTILRIDGWKTVMAVEKDKMKD